MSANSQSRFTITKHRKIKFRFFLWLIFLFLNTKKKLRYNFNSLRIAGKHKRSFPMSQTTVTTARRPESRLESREGSWLADEERDKSVCGWGGTGQSVNFHLLVLDLFVSFLVTQKFHLKTSSKEIL